MKSKSMQELTALIQEIDTACKERKNKLAPEIKKLRTLRGKFSEVEAEHIEKKRAYDAVQSSVDGEKERMDKEMGHGF